VVLSITYGCGACFQCQQSAFGLCEVGTPHLLNGTMPDGTRRLRRGSEAAALLACGASMGYGAVVRRARVTPGSSVLVIGAGGVGLSVVMAARLAGATKIIVSDMSEAALALAVDLGATHAVDVSDPDVNVIDEATRISGRGVDYAFDAVGAEGTLESAF